MARQPGSGLANATSAAIEDLLAAALRDDRTEIQVQRDQLRHECSIGRCGIDPDTVVRLVSEAVVRLDLEVMDAVAQPLDGLGDVRATLRGGQFAWFEVKAQTKKDRFSQLTQADWVRDETDLLRWLFHNDRTFAEHLPPWVADLLAVPNPTSYFQGWGRDSLWLADMALVVSRAARVRGQIGSLGALRDFVERKFVVHLTREGVRIVPLSLVGPVAGLLAGSPVAVRANYSNQAAASIAFACSAPAERGSAQFTYHVGYPARIVGRHKMHGRSITGGPNTVEVRP